MPQDRRIVHVLDDLAMGGVTRALKNFQAADLAGLGKHETVDIRSQTVKATSRDDIAIVHFTANWKKFSWLLNLRARGRFKKVILIEHTYTAGFEASEVEPKRRFHWMLRIAYSLVDQVIAVSNNQRDWILQHKLAPSAKVRAIPQSRQCDNLLKLDPVERSNSPLKIGAFGRFHKQKGFDLLIQAMARVPAHVAQLKLAGEGAERDRLKQFATGLPHVEIVDQFASPEAFLTSVDVVAIPSRWEAFGLVGTEARAAARPIIAADIDGLADQLDGSGFPHAANNIPSIVRAIYKAAKAQDLAQRGIAARTRAAGEFNTMVQSWSEVLARPHPVPADRIHDLAATLV
jgi:glycosyltransferase involved in cell wall biosynthesis